MSGNYIRSLFPEATAANQQGSKNIPAGILDKIFIPLYSIWTGREVKAFRKNQTVR